MYAVYYNFHNISKSCKEGFYCLELDEVCGFGRTFVLNKENVERLLEKLKELLDEEVE